MIEDITSQKQMEEELYVDREQRRQNELCRMLVEDSGMIIYDYDVLNDEMFYSIPAGDGGRRKLGDPAVYPVYQAVPAPSPGGRAAVPAAYPEYELFF